MARGTAVIFGDIFAVGIQYGQHCIDPRPCIVVTPPTSHGQTEVIALSSQMDLYVPPRKGVGPHFRIDSNHPDFAATNLRRTCYANSDEKHWVGKHELGPRIGRLEGWLLREFEKWYG